jgi:hypothetical protein
MRLARLAIVRLDPRPDRAPTKKIFTYGDVTLGIRPPNNAPANLGTVLVATATIPLGRLAPRKGAIDIPAEPRELCEDAIGYAADLLAVTARRRRAITSATPSVALIPENDEDRHLFSMVRGIRTPESRSQSTFDLPLLLDSSLTEALEDRRTGVMLMAEAYSHTTMSGRYRDFVRFFEDAFHVKFYIPRMVKALTATLMPDMRYSTDEIQRWAKLRHPFTHADGTPTRDLATEVDARGVAFRMEQAAMDILMNKAQWNNASTHRRSTWQPTAISTSSDGDQVIKAGSEASVGMLILDEFGVYPRAVHVEHSLPDDWFWRLSGMDIDLHRK